MAKENLSEEQVAELYRLIEDADKARTWSQISLGIVYFGFGTTLLLLSWVHPIQWLDSRFTFSVVSAIGTGLVIASIVLPVLVLIWSRYERPALRTTIYNRPRLLIPILNYLGNAANFVTYLGIFFSVLAIITTIPDLRTNAQWNTGILWGIVFAAGGFFSGLPLYVHRLRENKRVAEGKLMMAVKFRGQWRGEND